MTKLISKITPKTIKTKPGLAKVEEREVACAQIFGIATGTKIKTMPNGDSFTAIVGTFEAVNLHNGEVFRSGEMFLPGGIHETIEEPLKSGDDLSIRFAFELYAVPADNPIGYSWEAKVLNRPAEHDALADLRQAVMDDGVKPVLAIDEKPSKKKS